MGALPWGFHGDSRALPRRFHAFWNAAGVIPERFPSVSTCLRTPPGLCRVCGSASASLPSCFRIASARLPRWFHIASTRRPPHLHLATLDPSAAFSHLCRGLPKTFYSGLFKLTLYALSARALRGDASPMRRWGQSGASSWLQSWLLLLQAECVHAVHACNETLLVSTTVPVMLTFGN